MAIYSISLSSKISKIWENQETLQCYKHRYGGEAVNGAYGTAEEAAVCGGELFVPLCVYKGTVYNLKHPPGCRVEQKV